MKNIINNFREYQIELNQAELTIKTYCEYIENFVNEYDVTVENLEKISNSDFVKQWLKNELDKGLAPATVNKKKNTLSTFSKYLVLEGMISENKFKQLSNVKNDKKEIDIYTSEDTEKIFNYINNKYEEGNFQRKIDSKVYFTNYVAIKLMSSCALRVDELCSIQMSDLNMTTNKLQVRGKGGHGNVTRFSKLNKEMAELVKKYLEIRNEIKIKDGNEEYLFISAISKSKITDASIRKFIKKALEELNIETSSPCHAFRHHRASELISKGASVKSVSLYLGHSSEKVTEKYYIHQDEDVMDELSEL